MKLFGLIFTTLIMFLSSVSVTLACTSSDVCNYLCTREGAPPNCSATCIGYGYYPHCDNEGKNCVDTLEEGHCEFTALASSCPASDWGGWSTCVNFCRTRSCTTVNGYEIESCGGGTCGQLPGPVGCNKVCIYSNPIPTTGPNVCPRDAGSDPLWKMYETNNNDVKNFLGETNDNSDMLIYIILLAGGIR